MQADPLKDYASRDTAGSPSRWRRELGWSALTLLIVLAGGTNPEYPLVRLVAQLAGCALLAASFLAPQSRLPRFAFPDFIAIGAVLLVLAQIVPLPPDIWTAFPGRDFAAALDRAFLGGAQSRPLSLTPDATIASLPALLPPLGCYVAARSGGIRRTLALSKGLIAGAMVTIAMITAQRLTQFESALYPFELSDRNFAIGLFTNHNHTATFLLAAMPLGILVLLASPNRAKGPRKALPLLGAFLLLSATAVLLTSSRAGLALLTLTVVTLAICISLAQKWIGHRNLIAIAAAGALGIIVIAGLVLANIARLPAMWRDRALGEDRRFEFWPVASDLMVSFMPVGSGFGSFPAVYARAEPLDYVSATFINHAHNDYLELAIEGGIPALALVATGIGWIAVRIGSALMRTLRNRGAASDGDIAILLAGTALMPLLLHSIVDYPLRTSACASLLGIAAALLVKKPKRGLS